MRGYPTSYAGVFRQGGDEALEIARIEIPLIQRDYAQGRRTPRVDDIRNTFLDALHQALSDRSDDPTEDVKDEVGAAPEAIFDVIAEDPEIDHVSDHVQPAAMHEHVGDEGREGIEPDVPLGDLRHELAPIERVPIVERRDLRRLPRNAEDVDPHEDVRGEEHAVDDRDLLRRVLVAKRDQARSSVATTFDPWTV